MFFIDFDKEPQQLVVLTTSSVVAVILSLCIAYFDIKSLPEKG